MFRGAKKRTFRFGKKNVSFPKVETFRFADYKVQDELFTLKESYSDVKLELAMKRCERKKCGDREPQNGY